MNTTYYRNSITRKCLITTRISVSNTLAILTESIAGTSWNLKTTPSCTMKKYLFGINHQHEQNMKNISETGEHFVSGPSSTNIYNDELDSETFRCHRCKNDFSHTEGTWLPIGIKPSPEYITMLPEGTDPRFPTTPVAFFSLRAPEIITSDEFTCYDCVTEDDAADYINLDYNVAGSV